MAKSPLIHFPGALFHITARGNDRRNIFIEDPRDFQRYIQNLEKCKKKFPFKLYAFVFMPNHLHLLVEVGDYSINKIMQVLQTAYTMYFNKKYNHVGHLFQGRYKSYLVDRESYLLELIRYIILNPVRAGIVADQSDYPWSSHRAFLDSKHEFNRIIDREAILVNFSEDPNRQTEKYKEFVGTDKGKDWEDIFPAVAWGQIIGKERFIHSIERKLRRK